MKSTPTLLPDEPSVVDGLGGAHAKIAETIETLVRTSPGGRTIRLDGTWGSGKSTVIKMVANRLEYAATRWEDEGGPAPSDFAVFQYDAWVHSGDPLRRAFLSSLVTTLSEKQWLSETKGATGHAFWATRLEQLSRKLKITSRKTKPVFSATAKVVLAALMAIGAVLPMAVTLEQKLATYLRWPALITLTVTLGIVAFGLIHWLTDETLGFIVRRTSDEETVETREHPEPTSIEFQELFGDLMGSVLSVPVRRLLIVIDNLDRVDQAETQAVWVLLRSFLDNPNFARQAWFQKLWVVVPVAEERNVVSLLEASMAGADSSPPPTFLEKVFQVRFAVPPPMLHSWKNFFSAKLNAAFGPDLTGDYDEILRLYEEMRWNVPLTPRGIVSFINELVVLKLEWRDQVSLPGLAAYLLSRAQLSDDRCAPPDRVTRILREPDLADTFSMLHLRASSRKEASYLSMRPKLEQAMDNADTATLDQLFLASPAFEYVLDRYIREDLRGLDAQQERLLQALRALRPLTLSAASHGEDRAKLAPGTVAHLRTAAFETMAAGQFLRLLNAKLIAGLDAFIDIAADKSSAAQLIVEMLRNIHRSNKVDVPDNDRHIAQDWSAWALALENVMSMPAIKSIVDASEFSPILLPIGPALWARLCRDFGTSERGWILDRCASRDSPEKQLEWLKEEFTSKVPDSADVAVLEYAMRRGNYEWFDIVAEAVSRRLSDAKDHSLEYVRDVSVALLHVDRGRWMPFLRRLAENGTLLHYLHMASTVSNADRTVAIFVFLEIFATDGALKLDSTRSENLGRAIDGLAVLRRIVDGGIGLNATQAPEYADELMNLGLYDVLAILTNRQNTRALASTLVSALGNSERFFRYIAAQGHLKTEAIAFAGKYVQHETLRKELVDALLKREVSPVSRPATSVS